MNKQTAPTIDYGLCNDLKLRLDKENSVIYLSGTGDPSNEWVHSATQRAVHHLWFVLTHLIFPEKAGMVTSMAGTAMITANLPGITSFLDVKRDPQGHFFVVTGWVAKDTWSFHMTPEYAHQFWTALDRMLYPAGWEGTSTKRRPH